MAGSGQFRVVYPIEAFDGGLNNKYEKNILADIESPDCANVVFDDRGGVRTRNGMSKAHTAAVGTNAAGSLTGGDGLFTYRQNDGTETMLGWWNGSMYKFSGTSFVTVPSATSVFTAGQAVDAFTYQNLIFFGNGGSFPYKYNGTEFTRHGIAAPNSGPTLASGTAGTSGPAGPDIRYKVSYMNSYVVEGDVGAATATLTVASTATVSLTNLPLAPVSFGVNARKLYRLHSGSYKLVTTINDNTTTVYTDQTTDANLGAVAPTDNAEPPKWKFGISHQERGWLVEPTNPQFGYYTELANPFVVKTTNFIRIADGDGENITSVGVQENNVIFGKDASVWIIYLVDTDPTNWLRIKTLSKYGYASHFGKADYGNIQMFLGKRYNVVAGFMGLAGLSTQPNTVDLATASISSDSKSDRIEPTVFSFNTATLNKSCAIEYKNKLWFAVPGSGALVNNKVYQFDFQRRAKDRQDGSFVPFTYPVGFSRFTIYNGSLYAQASDSNGRVYRLDVIGQYNDDGTAINSYHWTKEFQGFKEHLENQKDFRFANFEVETLGLWPMNFTYLVDSFNGVGTTREISLSPGGSIWGNFFWGIGLWGGGQARKKIKIELSPASGKKIQFKFDNQNTVGQAFHVLPMGSFTYNLRGLR